MSWKEKYKDCLSPSGRLKSSVSPELKTEVFIARAWEVHGDKYDYSNVVYTAAKTKIEILCKDHGLFAQSPDNHLSWSKCPVCSKTASRKTTSEFIREAFLVHGNKYDYSPTIYTTATSKIAIGCKQHGIFSQLPNNHLAGKGCPECSGNKKSSTAEFIEKANLVHAYKYDYCLSEYVNAMTSLVIGCRQHGIFEQRPNDHLSGQGCPKCGVEKSSAGRSKSTDEFICEAKTVHNGTYDYSLVRYTNNHTKVSLICSQHGVFEQSPYNHLKGAGCPKCAGHNQNTVYIIEYLSAGIRIGTKVGITNNFDRRFKELKSSSPYDLEFVQCWVVDNHKEIESKALSKFTRVSSEGLGASFDGSTEILSAPTEEIAQFIEGLVYAS